ncbi:MAG: PIN domain-containing protein [bacterium]
MESKIKTIFLDANVIFSISYSGPERSRSYLLIELKKAKIIELVTSGIALEEASRNLELKRPSSLSTLKDIVKHIRILKDINPEEIECDRINSLPQDDRIIFASAVGHRANYFLTGNTKDFHHMVGEVVCGVKVMKPADFLHLGVCQSLHSL